MVSVLLEVKQNVRGRVQNSFITSVIRARKTSCSMLLSPKPNLHAVLRYWLLDKVIS